RYHTPALYASILCPVLLSFQKHVTAIPRPDNWEPCILYPAPIILHSGPRTLWLSSHNQNQVAPPGPWVHSILYHPCFWNKKSIARADRGLAQYSCAL